MGVDLPERWGLCRVADIAHLIRGVSYTKADATKESIEGFSPLLRANNINGRINHDDLVFVRDGRISDEQWLRPRDVLIAMSSGSKSLVGKAAQVRDDSRHTFGAFCGVLRPRPELDSAFFGWFFQTRYYRESVSADAKGSNINNLKRDHVLNVELPLPPLNEQRRIVEKIETLFARLDKGEEALREVQTLLARYRQSVLKAAVTGQLTADWRAENAHRLEHGRDLLERILQTRRKTWEGRGKYKEPAAPGTSDLPEQPEGWVWASVDQLLRSSLSNGRSVPDEKEGFPVLRLTALKDGRIDISERKIGAWGAESAQPFLIERGDILVSRGNGSKQLVGRGGLVADEPDPVAYPDTMIRIPILLEYLSPDWFLQLWNSPFMRSQIEKAAKTTAGIYKINQTDIRNFKMALPPLAEQKEVAAKVDEAFDKISGLDKWCETELARSSALRQSILKDAFAGRLVPQDPTDEPAVDLLARIKEARAATPRKTRKKATA